MRTNTLVAIVVPGCWGKVAVGDLASARVAEKQMEVVLYVKNVPGNEGCLGILNFMEVNSAEK